MKKLVLLITVIFLLSSCKDYLEEPQPTTTLTNEEVFSTSDNIRNYFNGIYRILRSSGVAHDSSGFGSILNSRNVSGNDIIRTVFSWYIFEYAYTARTIPNGRKNSFMWSLLYGIIDQTNVILYNLPRRDRSINKTEEAQLDFERSNLAFEAEARAIRAFAYFNLLQEFALPYLEGKNASELGVPIYTQPTTIESKGTNRSTVQEVYELIISDLEFAVGEETVRDQEAEYRILEERNNKSTINRRVAQGLLARVYLHYGNWNKTAQLAKLAREELILVANDYLNGFTDINSDEWIWGMFQTEDQNLGFAAFHSFWSIDSRRYPPFTVNRSLVNEFKETDIRRQTINSETSPSPVYGPPGESSFSTKFGFEDSFAEDVPLMRVAEMYLIEAEALARAGQETEARDALYELQNNRDPQAEQSDKTGGDLIDEILLERRKELYGEGLADYVDKKRLGLPIKRDGAHARRYRYSISPDSPCILYQIPLNEKEFNNKVRYNADCEEDELKPFVNN